VSRSLVRLGIVLLPALGLAALAVAPIAHADPVVSGPSVTLEVDRVTPGEQVSMTIDGFTTGFVTISVCGNEARRGSADCNMVASEGLHLDRDGSSSLARMPIAAPPAPCPCIIRVSSRLNDEIAVAPIELIGHPVAPVVEQPARDGSLAVAIHVRAAPDGVVSWGRSSLGGPARYEVTVTVKNRTAVPIEHVKVVASAGRDAQDDLVHLQLDEPGKLGPGQTWQQVVTTEVPAPSFGDLVWRVDASGAGPSATAMTTTRHSPLLFMVVVALFVLDIGFLAIRFVIRRRIARGGTVDIAQISA